MKDMFMILNSKSVFSESSVLSCVQFILYALFYSQASRKWLENLYPSSDKRQRTADNITRRSRGMTEVEVEKRVREVVVARFYSLAKVIKIFYRTLSYVRRRAFFSDFRLVGHFSFRTETGEFVYLLFLFSVELCMGHRWITFFNLLRIRMLNITL